MAAEEAYQRQLAKRLGLRNSAVNKREAEPDHSEGDLKVQPALAAQAADRT